MPCLGTYLTHAAPPQVKASVSHSGIGTYIARNSSELVDAIAKQEGKPFGLYEAIIGSDEPVVSVLCNLTDLIYMICT